jgi:hypothetical protein
VTSTSLAHIRAQVESRVPGALSNVRPPAPEMFPSGIEVLDRLIGGVPRRALTQICSAAGVSAGRTALLLALLAKMTGQGEFCTLVDAGDGFDAESAEAAGVDLSRLLWVRCEGAGLRSLEKAFKAVDILAQNGGFGLIAVDLSSIPDNQIRKVPLSTWFRFTRVMEKAPTALVFVMGCPAAQSCAGLTLRLTGEDAGSCGGELSHARVLARLRCQFEIGRTRLRKPVQSAFLECRNSTTLGLRP